MTTRTERIGEIFWTVILFVITAICYFLGYIFWTNGKIGFSVFTLLAAFGGTILTLAGIRVILIRRWTEQIIQIMRKMQKEKEENR